MAQIPAYDLANALNGTELLVLDQGGVTKRALVSQVADYIDYSLPVATGVTLGGVLSGGGITVDGAGNVTVVNDSHTHDWSNITGRATTLAGYGITDAAPISHTHSWSQVTGRPNNLAGYGITDAAPISHLGGNQHLDWTVDQGGPQIDPANLAGVGDHTQLSNIGTNTHAQIDTHISNNAIHLDWTNASDDFSTSGTVTTTGIVNAADTFAAINTRYQDIGGGTNASVGAVLRLYGGANGTRPNDFDIIANGTPVLVFDESNNSFDFQSNDIIANNLSGTNTGDQTITLTGDVTGSGTGTFATTVVEANVNHNNLANYVAEEHANWTIDQSGSYLIHHLNLPEFTTTLKGAVPGSGGGTANFLRADGTWAAPPGTTNFDYFSTWSITDTDSGYSWTGSGNLVANGNDNVTLVSGLGINLDIDAGNNATRVSINAGTLAPALDHDTLSNVDADQHRDWTTDQGGTMIDTANYVNTVYTHPNHTGHIDSTGDGVTTLNINAIIDQTILSPTLNDYFLYYNSFLGVLARTQFITFRDFIIDELPLFTSTDRGLTPLSGGGTANFLRADGAWATPPGVSVSTSLSDMPGTRGTGGDVLGPDLFGTAYITFDLRSQNAGNVLTQPSVPGGLYWNGDYGDLINTPTIVSASGSNVLTNSSGAFWDGDYNDLINTPGTVTDHGGLSGLADNDHPQYARIAINETITGQWDFSESVDFNSAVIFNQVVDFNNTANFNIDAYFGSLGQMFISGNGSISTSGTITSGPISASGLSDFERAIFQPTGDGGNILTCYTENGTRPLQLAAPLNANTNDPFVWSTSNSVKWTVDGSDAFEVTSAGTTLAHQAFQADGTATFGGDVNQTAGKFDFHDAIWHTSGGSNRLYFSTITYIASPGDVRMRPGGSGTDVQAFSATVGTRPDANCAYLQDVTGTYGSIQIDGAATGGYEGYSIGGRVVFMHDNNTQSGIYNDVNNQWMLRSILNAQTELFYAGAEKLETISTGVNVTGEMRSTTAAISSGAISDTMLQVKTTEHAGLTAGDRVSVARFGDPRAGRGDCLEIYALRRASGGTAGDWVNQNYVIGRYVDNTHRSSIEIGNNAIYLNTTVGGSGVTSTHQLNGWSEFELTDTVCKFFNNEVQIQNDGDIHADGDVFAFSTTTSSDIKLKKDLVPIEGALDKINSLQGYTYTMKKNDKRMAGLIAQDVEKVLPEAVKYDDVRDHKNLDYNAVIGLLVEAVKELQTELKEFKNGTS